MNKKIIILNGSPHKQGNTSKLTASFRKGAEVSGNTVTEFHLDSMNINGCKGCFCGGKDFEFPCVQNDDMNKIYPIYREADVVVLASPLYYWNLSGQLRTAFDRLFAVAECNPDYSNPKKDAVLLMAAEGDEFDDVLLYYKNLMKHLDWTDLGYVLAGGVMMPNDIEGHKELEEAYKLGLSI
ncbi:MAG: flavodoxin family protein [Phascolarctobacterium sp.]|nr:flavodoxin family protein [Phascolarctobacterium sp.]